MHGPKADAVIVCHGASAVLERAVDALLADPAVERVILVDNGRTDGQPARVRQERGDRVVLAGDGANVGFGAGVNAGARSARAEFLAIVNPDCVAGPGAVGRLLRTLDADRSASAAGGLLLNEDGSEQEGGRRRVPSLVHAVARRLRLHRAPLLGARLDFNDASRPLPAGPEAVDALSGAFMVVRRDRFAEVGGFDERFFLHFEDLDLCVRLRAAGGTLLFDPASSAVHRKGESSAAVPLFVAWHKHRSFILFRRKHARGIGGWCALPFVAVAAGGSLAASTIRGILRQVG